MQFALYGVLIAIVVVADQATKKMAVAHLTTNPPVPVLPFLDFSLAYNTGAAFSFLGDAGGWQMTFFIVTACLVVIFLLNMLWRALPTDRQTALACALIIGGAVGNLIDRAVLGYVVDFIHFFYETWHFPTFNIADSAIFIGVALLLADAFGWRLIPHKNV